MYKQEVKKLAEKNNRLSDKHKLFIDEYIKTGDARGSYKKVYPHVKDSTADVNGSKLLKHTKVKAYYNSQFAKMDKKRIADAQEVLEYLSSVMRGETKEEVVIVEGQGEGISQARVVEKKPSEKDRLKAGEMLAKRYALLTDAVKLESTTGIKIVNDIPKDEK